MRSAGTFGSRGVFIFGPVMCFAVLILLLQPDTAVAGHLNLPEGLRLAVENSRLLRAASLEEGIAEADSLVAGSKMLPSVDASFSQAVMAYQPTAIFGPQPVPLSQKNFVSYGLGIQQTLYDFKKSSSRFEATRTLLNVRRLETRRTKNLVAIEFVLAYLELLESERLLRVAEKEVERLESHLKDARHLFEEGVITKNDLLQAEVRISDARQRLLTSGNLRAVSASRLNTLLVRPLNEEIVAEDVTDLAAATGEIEIGRAWETAEKQRPEIRITDETMKALMSEETAKKAEYFPKIFVKGGFDYTENRYQQNQGNWSLTLGMNINLFSGWSTDAEVLKIQRQKAKLSEERNRLLDGIRLEVEKYILDSKTARQRVAVTRDAVSQAEENHRINRARYEEGVGTATDVLDAVTLLTMAETNFFRSLYDLRRAEAAVLYATGNDLAEVYK
ncbi:MAG: TolC family protein [Nitrospirae bacterium]|nr:TolC family protein [Nitrospirota bacterium]